MNNYRVLKNDLHDAVLITSGYVPVILHRPALFLCKFWGWRSCEMWHRVDGHVAPEVSEERISFVFEGREVTVSYHLLSFRGSVQDYKIRMDMEIVIFA